MGQYLNHGTLIFQNDTFMSMQLETIANSVALNELQHFEVQKEKIEQKMSMKERETFAQGVYFEKKLCKDF